MAAGWYNCASSHKSAAKRPLNGPLYLAQQTTEKRTISYADSGVDIERANRTKQRIKYLAHKTFNRGVLSEIGGFGGLFAIDKKKYRRSGAGLQRGRRGHQAENRL